MLKSISLENYKCFKKKTDIEIKPLTILCGVNSSGKSSILKSLLMLKQSYDNESPYNEMTFNGEYTDNGFFDDIISHIYSEENVKQSFKLSNTFIITNTLDDSGYTPVKRQDITSFKELKRIYYKKRNVYRFEISIDIEVSKNNKNNTEDNILYFIENNIVNYSKIEIRLKDSNDCYMSDADGFIEIIKNNDKDDRIYNIRIRNIPDNNGYFQNNDFTCACYFSNMHLSNVYQTRMSDKTKALRPTILSLWKIAALQYKGIEFIAPLRQHPQRNYMINSNINSVGIAGENAPILLAKIEDKDVNTDVHCKYLHMDNIDDLRMKYGDIVQEWMDYIGLGKLNISHQGNSISINISEHNIADVGFGVSQALPVLVQGVYMSKDQTLLLEQPEIHLHPKMQLAMADFLITLSKHERNIIVETHSDHFVNRIIHRIMEDYRLNDIINIVFVSQNENKESEISLIQVDECKGIINAPDDFFSQFGTETKDIVDTGFKNMMEKIKK